MRRLPLFPLPVVLFPGASLPLHVFEPRYQQMIAHCLEGDRRFGLVYHDPDRSGPFEMDREQVGCIAEIMDFQPLQDGRSLLVTRGLERFRLVDGIESDALYFEGLVEEYRDDEEPEPQLTDRVEESRLLFQQVLQHLSSEPQPLPPLEEMQPLSFHIVQWIRIDAAWHQTLLEMRSERARLEQIDELLKIILSSPA